MNALIDTTEMYLRTVYELEEEGVIPLRARIAERLGQSGPTVSQTVARMDRDGLLWVAQDRHLQLTRRGRERAIAVMRKHRLAERLLVDVIGLEWEHAHSEACRWEHVMSEAVERKLVQLLDHPTTSPYGNPIPGLDRLYAGDGVAPGSGIPTGTAPRSGRPTGGGSTSGEPRTGGAASVELVKVDEVARKGGGRVEIRSIAEHAQLDVGLLSRFKAIGLIPGSTFQVSPSPDHSPTVELRGTGAPAKLQATAAHAVLAQAG